MLSIHISSWHITSAHASVPDAHAHWMHQFITHMLSMFAEQVRNWCICWGFASVSDTTLSAHISSWLVCSVCASVHDTYAQHVLKGPFQISYVRSEHALVPDVYAQCTHQFLTCMLSACISSFRVCSGYASIHDGHALCTYQLFTCMLRVYNMNIWKWEKLMRMLSVRISLWRSCLIHPSDPD